MIYVLRILMAVTLAGTLAGAAQPAQAAGGKYGQRALDAIHQANDLLLRGVRPGLCP